MSDPTRARAARTRRTGRLLHNFLPRILPTLAFAVRDRVKRAARRDAMIVLKNSLFEADTMTLILDLLAQDPGLRVVAVAQDREKCLSYNAHLIDQIPGENFAIVQDRSPAFRSALLNSFVVFVTSAPDLLLERLCGRARVRAYVRLNHGILGKADYRMTPRAMARQRNGVLARLFAFSPVGIGLDVTAVASRIEAHCCAAAEGGFPNFYRVLGYPRFDRCDELASGSADPWLPQDTRDVMESTKGRFRILYTPTHKDQEFDSTFFPLAGYTKPRLIEALKKNNAAMFLRLHPMEEKKRQFEGLVDDEWIFLAGQKASPSVIEIMPFMDMLITDYSSIYFEFLPFDRPILFVQDELDSFRKSRDFILEYEQYSPGPKINDFNRFEECLGIARRTDDPWREDRRFVGKVLLPRLEQRFIHRLMRHKKIDRLMAARAGK